MGVMERVKAPATKRRTPKVDPANLPLDSILQGDCVAMMSSLPAASVDMIFADPPYNIQLGGDLLRSDGRQVDAVDADWDKFDSLRTYERFTHAWPKEERRIQTPKRRVWGIGRANNIIRVGTPPQ